MIGNSVAPNQDFWLFEPNVFSTAAEKRLIELLLEEDFLDDPWLQRRLGCYVQTDTTEKDRIVLDIIKYFFRERLPDNLFAVIREFDSVFASLGKKGHFLHQFEVLIFGWALIRMLVEHDKSIRKAFHFKTSEKMFSVWLLASVIHDIGYPMQLSEDLMKKLFAWYQALGMSEVAKLFKKPVKDFKKSMAKNLAELKSHGLAGIDAKGILLEALQDSLKISRAAAEMLLENIEVESKGEMHGYAGALVLCGKLFQSWAKRRLPPTVFNSNVISLKLAMAAIFLHDLPNSFAKYIRKINFRRNPYAYLLFLVDNLQEWSRNLRPNEAWPSYNLEEVDRKGNELKLSYILTHEKWTKNRERKAKRSVREKFKRLNLMTKPNPRLGFQITVNFRTSHGQKLGRKKILL